MTAGNRQVRRDSRLFAAMSTALLRAGHAIQFHAQGKSMEPNVENGDQVVVAPAEAHLLRVGDIALLRNQDGLRVHRVVSLGNPAGKIMTQGDAGLEVDAPGEVLGRVVGVERSGEFRKLDLWQIRIVHPAKSLLRRVRIAAGIRLRRWAPAIFGGLLLGSIGSAGLAPAANAQADLALTQAAAPLVVASGSNITYTETVTNNGPNAATTVVLYQQTPLNTTFVSLASPGGWTCTLPAVGGTGSVTCTKNTNLANAGTASFTYVVKVGAGVAAGTTILNSANVTSQTADPTPQNNATTTKVLVESATGADAALTMTATPSPVFVASTLTYNITVQNLGLVSATGVTVTDTLPVSVSYVSAIPSQGSCSGTATVTCNLGTLTNGSSATIAIVVTTPSAANSLSNTASVATSSTDPVAGNNSATVITVAQPLSCAKPGNDGAGTAITGVVNTYYPPSAANATIAAGTNTIALGAASGSTTPIAIGDLLLIMQMQDATINSTNTSSYGDGIPGDPGTGWLALNSSGLYEFVTATSAVPIGGGSLTFTGTGSGGGALNTYTEAPYGTNGQKTFQVIRVPQYTNVTLGAGLTALGWTGTVGGVLAIDVASQLNLSGSTVDVSGLGFRGGAGRRLGGAAGYLLTDYVTPATAATNGSKGEGIAGTPRYVANVAMTNLTDTGVEGYPTGSYARGAPATAGAGATDANPSANDENSGGGGAGNGGAGGYGGYGWNTAGIAGGNYGSAFPASTNAMVMGSGGGAGTTNDGTAYPANGNPAGINSSGASGGGIIIVRAGSVTGTGTFNSNGTTALNVQNDGGGGGGAGGTILTFTNTGSLTGLTLNANGGNGGNTWQTSAPGAWQGNRHGPGGGGGGGAILLSSTPTSLNVLGGNNGYTTTAEDAFGATPGSAGTSATNLTITQTPGTQSGAYCATADLSVTNVGSPAVVVPGNNITYTQVVTNNSKTFDAQNAVFSETTPANTTFQSIVVPSGWTCTYPAVGASGLINCTNPGFTSNTSSTFTIAVQVVGGTTTGTQIVDVANITSGTSDPNLANNTATALTTVAAAGNADLQVTNAASSATVQPGSTITFTGTVTNLGPAGATGTGFSETLPANTTFNSLVAPPGWTCYTPAVNGTGSVSCTYAGSFASGNSATFPLVLNVPGGTTPGTVITATDNISAATQDPNTGNNTGSASTTVATSTQADLSVTASGTPNPVTLGNNIAYVETVTNNGPATETNATFTVAIPANTTLGATFNAPAGWTCTPAISVGGTGTFTCTLNGGSTILSGASVNFPLVVNVNSSTPPGTTITLNPQVSSSVSDPNSSNNAATVTTLVASPTQADLSITKTASPEPVNQGTNLTYALQVTNGGPAVAKNVTVTDPIPAQVTYGSVTTSQGTCSYNGGTTTVSCSLGSLAVGSTALITINASASTFSSASLSSNTATVSSSTSDPNSANNSSTATSTIQAPTAVDISAFHANVRSDGAVVLEWKTKEESRNLGFHIYREAADGKQRINSSILAGSAFLLRGSRPQHAAKAYQWLDAQPVPDAAYWIEDVDINGTRTMHGPVYAEMGMAATAGREPAAMAKPALTLSEVRTQAATSLSVGRQENPPLPEISGANFGTQRVSFANQRAVKISTEREGWYRVPLAQLIAAGLPAGTEIESLHLYAEGIEQPLLITGPKSGVAGAGDAIEFYGTGIDTPYSGTRVYWVLSDSHPGKRVNSAPVGHATGTAADAFPFTVVRRDRTVYFAALLNGEDNDNFFGDVVTNEPVDEAMTIAHLQAGSAIASTLTVTLQGGTDGMAHSVSVELNGASLGTMQFNGQALYRQSFPVDASLLHEGNNTVTLTALNGDNDVSAVQSIALTYPHSYVADGDWLRASVTAGTVVTIGGFQNAQVRVFDLTDPLNILELPARVNSGTTGYVATVTTPHGWPGTRTILALSEAAVSQASEIAPHTPLPPDRFTSGGDFVVIAHPEFVEALTPLVKLRQSQGHRVYLATTEQIYDAYNYGEKSPYAIRAFLQHTATQWERKTRSVLLVGDASVDPRNFLGFGDFDFVPTREIQTAAFKTASDDWFTDFQQTGYATLPTGRLPARTAADAALMVAKIVNYEQSSPSGSWESQAYFISDQNVDANFTGASQAAANLLPTGVQTTAIVADGQDSSAARAQILAALNAGSLLVNYSGHGAEQQWSFLDLFNTDDAAGLKNGQQLPVYVLMDCLNGYFQDVYAQSLAEALMVSPNGGAVAVWASSGFTDQAPQAAMDQALYLALGAKPGASIGSLFLQAKSGITDNDVRRTWILFGDPTMHLKIATSGASSPWQQKLFTSQDEQPTEKKLPRKVTP